MSDSKNLAKTGWKILAFGRGQHLADKAKVYLDSLGYQTTVLSLADDPESDQKLIDALKKDQFDAVSVGGGINGYDKSYNPDFNQLMWFNRLVNIIHENSPKSTKLIFVTSPDDIDAGVRRILGEKNALSTN
ncbi:unnamed protein product [Didymodactylos carnosus]|uniref:Uncharacterized protein n=1 Tax=Didymodactylos carnosus TaxID=1234261 RepID=A0A815NKP2_9BILA|nr:unnamed protein product [Didymodactylos carnosus]CAF1437785.1 unnamed protein product [Didymodactylos carnosus]CAF4108627.1 unnamed protein product [Didymodactylos carnosus]CAF4315006.1 unnamed protein product [Didymodactylos carnosus]